MKKLFQSVICASAMVIFVNSYAQDCVKCGVKEVSGMPKSTTFDNIEKISKNKMSAHDRLYEIKDYCIKFSITNQQMVGSLIKQMEKTPITPEEFLSEPICQPDAYSEVVKSPMIHMIADDITKREEFLQNIWNYYSKKLKKPEIFDRIIKSKNTHGESLLDYLETMRLRKQYEFDDQKLALNKIVRMLCDHGAVYSKRTNLRCPKK